MASKKSKDRKINYPAAIVIYNNLWIKMVDQPVFAHADDKYQLVGISGGIFNEVLSFYELKMTYPEARCLYSLTQISDADKNPMNYITLARWWLGIYDAPSQ